MDRTGRSARVVGLPVPFFDSISIVAFDADLDVLTSRIGSRARSSKSSPHVSNESPIR